MKPMLNETGAEKNVAMGLSVLMVGVSRLLWSGVCFGVNGFSSGVLFFNCFFCGCRIPSPTHHFKLQVQVGFPVNKTVVVLFFQKFL